MICGRFSYHFIKIIHFQLLLVRFNLSLLQVEKYNSSFIYLPPIIRSNFLLLIEFFDE